MFPKFTHKYPG